MISSPLLFFYFLLSCSSFSLIVILLFHSIVYLSFLPVHSIWWSCLARLWHPWNYLWLLLCVMFITFCLLGTTKQDRVIGIYCYSRVLTWLCSRTFITDFCILTFGWRAAFVSSSFDLLTSGGGYCFSLSWDNCVCGYWTDQCPENIYHVYDYCFSLWRDPYVWGSWHLCSFSSTSSVLPPGSQRLLHRSLTRSVRSCKGGFCNRLLTCSLSHKIMKRLAMGQIAIIRWLELSIVVIPNLLPWFF